MKKFRKYPAGIILLSCSAEIIQIVHCLCYIDFKMARKATVLGKKINSQ